MAKYSNTSPYFVTEENNISDYVNGQLGFGT